jgi:hypoxanthine phosphoribosyltransferase
MVNSKQYKIDVLISESEIKQIVDGIAQQIKRDFEGEEIVLVGILNGAFVFLHDLVQSLQKLGMQNMIIDFMGMDTYGESTESSAEPKITKDLKQDIRDKNVIIVDDIVDTGFSISILQAMLKARQPKKLVTAAMLSKDERREIEVQVEYIGKHIPNKFVIGYGLDYEGKYHRELPYIGTVSFDG